MRTALLLTLLVLSGCGSPTPAPAPEEDADNKPVWGPEAGPYVFKKTADEEPKAAEAK